MSNENAKELFTKINLEPKTINNILKNQKVTSIYQYLNYY